MAPPEVVSRNACPLVPAFVERPLLFSGAMVMATIRDEDPKTQTRRVLKQATGPSLSVGIEDEPGVAELSWLWGDGPGYAVHETVLKVRCPYGQAGDRLWVRETHFAWGCWETRFSGKKGRDEWHFVDMTCESGRAYRYAAEGGGLIHIPARRQLAGALPGWWKRPAIFMPRAASRIDLEVTGVRVEHLQSISEEDCYAEGIDTEGPAYNEGENYVNAGSPIPAAHWAYNTLWEEINGKGPYHWEANPWVWVVEFRRIRPC